VNAIPEILRAGRILIVTAARRKYRERDHERRHSSAALNERIRTSLHHNLLP
jgi:hypothetical protein